MHQAGFVHLIGKPNTGKSTLFNQLIDYPLSIVSPKPQTTRQNILGIAQSLHYQAIYVDTPGYLTPMYQLQAIMMRNVHRALIASDLLLWMVDIRHRELDPLFIDIQKQARYPILLLLNKADLINKDEITQAIEWWKKQGIHATIHSISAKDATQVKQLSKRIIQSLPPHPPYYDKETLTDKPAHFFAAEILRKAIFTQYKEEIPYSTAVLIDTIDKKEDLVVIQATIYVERLNQKKILIGKKGAALKLVGIHARKDLEDFFQKKVFLEQYVKVLPNWRENKQILKKWGYY